MAIDPICDMTVSETTQLRVLHGGVTYYFCCDYCRRKFARDPLQALRQATERAEQRRATRSGTAASSPGLHGIEAPSTSASKAAPVGGLVSLGLGPPPQPVHEPAPSAATESAQNSTATPATGGYFCPMCPEIHSDVPAACPKCGMALEAVSVTPGAEDTTELDDLTRRFQWALAATLPLFLLAMLPMQPMFRLEHGSEASVSEQTSSWLAWSQGTAGRWLQAILASVVLFGAGWPLLARGVRTIFSRYWNMFTLIAIGTLAAFGFSCIALLLPGLVPESLFEHGVPPIYFESAAVIMTLVLLGQVLELHSRRRTGDAIRELVALAPPTARRFVPGANGMAEREEEVALSDVRVGDLLKVRPGEKVPVDGIVVDGQSEVSESLVTGEPMPIAKRVGDSTIGGTLNESGMLIIRAAHVGQETVLARIIQLVAQAQRSRAPVQQLTDTVAGWFVPLVVSVAILTFCGWLWWGGSRAWTLALVNSVAVLIIACPCALGLATPMSIMVGVGAAARRGILIRNAEVIEQLAHVNLILFDKTGTLTVGKPAVVALHTADGVTEQELLERAVSVEQHSEHPLGRAILEYARQQSVVLSVVTEFQSWAGQGAAALCAGELIRVGKRAFVLGEVCETSRLSGEKTTAVDSGVVAVRAAEFNNSDTSGDPWKKPLTQVQQQGQTVIFVSVQGKLLGMLVLADELKFHARESLDELRREGLKLVMVTGDSEAAARSIASRLGGMDEVQAGLLPQDKIAIVQRYREQGYCVAMVGDGVNDAPALAAASVGIALGTGSDVAIESAGVTLLGGEPSGVLRAIQLGRRVMRNVKQNLFFAFFYNALGIPLAAGVLQPIFGLVLNPMIAALAMSFSSVSVIANALRLRRG
ncbi:MAG: heavy metal translocating P-type ATPase [Planctomycetota bacterium]